MNITNLYHLSIKDVFITPLYLIILCLIVYIVAQRIRDEHLKKYFLYGIYIKFAGGIIFGLIYAFFYSGGDTFGYWLASRTLDNAFWDSPVKWAKLLMHVKSDPSVNYYIHKLQWYKDNASYFPCRIAGFLSPFCFNTYSVMALFFALISFNGLWHLFLVFYNLYPHLHRKIAISIFFLPSMFFWGSGIMKEPLVLAGLGWFVYSFYFGLVLKVRPVKCLILAVIGLFFLLSIKPYVIGAFFVPMMIWLYILNIKRFRSLTTKFFFSIFSIVFSSIVIFVFFNLLSANAGYSLLDLSLVAEKIETTNNWITYSSGKDGSTYNIGKIDGTVQGTLALAPSAIFVSLFRPMLWEVRNAAMFMASLESTWLLFLTLYIFIKVGLVKTIKAAFSEPTLIFCFTFSIIFAFITGVSSGNFGALVRYKVPLLPFFFIGLFILEDQTAKLKRAKQALIKNKRVELPV